MPPLIHLDRYDTCLHANNDTGVYCSVDFSLVTDEPSELYTMILNYSARHETHFNHTRLIYGVCLTKTCNQYYKRNTTADLRATLEECLNDTMWREYKLKTRVGDKYTCNRAEEKIKLDVYDCVVAICIAILLILNFAGTLQEVFFGLQGNPFLNCFSIRANWRKLVVPAGEGLEPRLTRLKGVYGIKALTMMLVIMCHSILPAVFDPDNPQYLEEVNRNTPIISAGSVVVQTFFIVSGFLMLYNMLLDAEKHKHTWFILLQGIAYRWMRLTPTYMVILAVTATWMRHFGTGPLWQLLVVDEVQDCRRDWWVHPLFISNYVDYSTCMIQTWYIAADFQLFCLGMLVYTMTNSSSRKILLLVPLVASVIIPAAHTYFQDLDGVLLLAPETSRTFLLTDPTFNHVYKRGHTNVASFVVGMFTAMVVYHLQKNDNMLQKVQKYRSWFYLSVPAMGCLLLLNGIFYQDGARASVYFRAVYAGANKPVYAAAIGTLIVGMVFKLENVYRNILEWSGWAVPSRLTYSAYIIHMLFIKVLNATRTTTMHFSFLHFIEYVFASITISFLAAVPLHLLVEAPFNAIVKLIFSRPAKKEAAEKDVEIPNSIGLQGVKQRL